MRVLIVDDDRMDRTILRRMLDGPCRVDLAEDGRMALRRFKRGLDEMAPYAVVVMDIGMPFVGGVEAAQAMRRMEKSYGVAPGSEARIVFVTMHDDPRSVVRAYFRGGADAYILKPVIERLRDVAREVGSEIGSGLRDAARGVPDAACRRRTSGRRSDCRRAG